jgi:hypothetical protein
MRHSGTVATVSLRGNSREILVTVKGQRAKVKSEVTSAKAW